MTAVKAIQTALAMTQKDLEWFLSDFSDADMFVRPVPGANHAAWQMGNIIIGDIFLVREELPDAKFPELPAGFLEKHSSENAKDDGPAGFLSKDGYLKLFAAVRAATIAAVGSVTDADLDKPSKGSMKDFAPTLAALFIMTSNHTHMHAGQFSVIRRKLGKPVLF